VVRTDRIIFRINARERQVIEELAAHEQLGISEYLRLLVERHRTEAETARKLVRAAIDL
jgi:hypothetical protein